ncbi:MAG: hypothetical protein KDK40_03790 [Chlamydiia bacterium]|nr:hypothetical protein [Chlamydiia bacterium]
MIFYRALLILLLAEMALYGAGRADSTRERRQTLLSTIPRRNIAKGLAFYELYRETPEGQEALKRVVGQLAKRGVVPPEGWSWQGIPHEAVTLMLDLVVRAGNSERGIQKLPPSARQWIEVLGSSLANRRLKGYGAQSLDTLFVLEPSEIDLARGMFLSHLSRGEMGLDDLANYEAMLDLIALQVMSQAGDRASPEALIAALNQFIFFDINVRFPPLSEFAKEIDRYSFLPAVLDSRRGVCLGVSVLYVCVAQRLGVPVEMITPPGHIYVRTRRPDGSLLNIETTMRGVHVDSRAYLGIELDELHPRSNLEAIGMVHMNQGGVYWQRKEYARARDEYRHALRFMKNDPMLLNVLGYMELLSSEDESARGEGMALLREAKRLGALAGVEIDRLVDDLLDGRCGIEAIDPCHKQVEERYDELIAHGMKLKELSECYPEAKCLIFHRAVNELRRHRIRVALPLLEQYHSLDPSCLTVEYFLSGIYTERQEFTKAWLYLDHALQTVSERGREVPLPLVKLRRALQSRAPRALWN